jgi:hypothetical protein
VAFRAAARSADEVIGDHNTTRDFDARDLSHIIYIITLPNLMLRLCRIRREFSLTMYSCSWLVEIFNKVSVEVYSFSLCHQATSALRVMGSS